MGSFKLGGKKNGLHADILDWVHLSDEHETSAPRSMQEDVQRIQILKSYLFRDAEKEEVFERLTGLAVRFFKVQSALVITVDIGRLMSNRGLSSRIHPRRHTVSTQPILGKGEILIVTDATKDDRFKDNPAVTDKPAVRFYAGAVSRRVAETGVEFEFSKHFLLTSVAFASFLQPLVSPEGYKLGTFCVLDSKPKPDGLSEDDQAFLKDLADLTVREMVIRKSSLAGEQSPAKMIAYTAHDLMTPLTGVQLSLSLLKEDEEVKEKLGGHQQELLSTAANCSDLMIRICQTALDTLREDTMAVPNVPTSAVAHAQEGSSPITKMPELIKSLTMIMDPIPKKVPMILTLDTSLPHRIVCDDLKLFRSTLNLVSNGITRTELGVVHMKIYLRSADNSKIIFECFDTGPEIEAKDHDDLFNPGHTSEGEFHLGLSSVATLVKSLDGEYGYRHGGLTTKGQSHLHQKGSTFWFSIPLYSMKGVGSGSESLKSFGDNSGGYGMTKTQSTKSLRGSLDGISDFFAAQINGHSSKNACLLHATQSPGRNSPFPITKSGTNSLATITSGPPRNIFTPAMTSIEPASSGADYKMAAPASVSAAVAPTTRKSRALIIEDSLVVRKSVARALERMGMTVAQAVNGAEGLERLKAKMYDFVLCDFLMPVMDGIDCVRQYREWEKQNRPHFSQYIVGISAHANANDGNKGINAGMNEFRQKPISVAILAAIREDPKVSSVSRQLDESESKNEGFESGASNQSLQSMSDKQSHSFKSGLNLNRNLSGTLFGTSPKRPAVSTSTSSRQNEVFEVPQPFSKRQRTDNDVGSIDLTGSPACLIASDWSIERSSPLVAAMEARGWKVIHTKNGQHAMQLLKKRVWDAILLDDQLTPHSGSSCCKAFRHWERQNRANRQRNFFFLCSIHVPSVFDKASTIQPPTGFDGVLGKPVVWEELNHLLHIKKDRSMEIIMRNQLN